MLQKQPVALFIAHRPSTNGNYCRVQNTSVMKCFLRKLPTLVMANVKIIKLNDHNREALTGSLKTNHLRKDRDA